jgi:hypothetical protein
MRLFLSTIETPPLVFPLVRYRLLPSTLMLFAANPPSFTLVILSVNKPLSMAIRLAIAG